MGAIGEDELAKWEKMAGDGGEERIVVSVRVRPLNSIEISRNDPVDWECINNTSIIHRNGLSDRSLPQSTYSFDRVFGQECTTRQVYEDAAKRVVLSVVNGINSSIFAYGQTSSGKTYTMTGITEYSVFDIYDYIEKHEEREFVVKFSAIEIYNEAVRDLLSSDPTPLRLLDDPERGTIVEKLTEETLRDREHLQELLSVCEAERQIGETSLNEMSSRSHQILRLTIESTVRQFFGGENFSSLAASVNFVDLAGSERASQALSAGTRLKEGCHINRSLLTLGTVIRKLSKGRNGHIPYRDSKLTRILQSSLGGNARTAIICTMSPARSHIEQSRNTLLFATCAKEVATSAQVNVVMSDKALVRHLQKELARLESELRSPNSAPKSSHHAEAIKERDTRITKMEKEIKELIEQRDLAQSRLDEMLLVTREWDQVSQNSASNAQITYEDVISSSETSGMGHQSQNFSVISFESSTGSRSCEEIEYEQSETQEVEEVDSVSSKYIAELVRDVHQKTSEKSRDEYGDLDELCKEVQCIEMQDNKRITLLLTDETEFLVPLNTIDFTKIQQHQQEVQVQVQIQDQGQYLIEKINESSPFEELKDLKTTEEEEVPPVKSTNEVLSRSMSCRERLMNNNSCSNSPTLIDKIEPSPYVKERRQSALEFNIELENCQEPKSKSNEIPKTVSEDDITSISRFVDGLKEMAQIHCQEKERTISEHIAERKTVKDVCLQAVSSPCESPSRWPIEFEKKRQEIIELWHACNVSLIHRTYFFLLFKGDPADSIYLEVEKRRLSFLKNNNTSTTFASSLKNLRREREMLIRQMQKRMTTMEREELYSKWGISLESKRRRMQLAKKLWSETKNIEDVKESAAIVAKLIGLLEPEHALKEMFGLSFAPQLTHRRSFSWKNGK